MQEQNYKNHTRLLFSYHGLSLFPMLALMVWTTRNLITSTKENFSDRLMMFMVVFILASVYYYARIFALKAQDRAIRAEENFRYFALTGKRMDERITISQIIALRFASDDELPLLTQKAADENLTGKEIKKQIRNWRADWHRV